MAVQTVGPVRRLAYLSVVALCGVLLMMRAIGVRAGTCEDAGRLVENLLRGLSSGEVVHVATLLTDDFKWNIERPDGGAAALTKAQTLQAVRLLQNGSGAKPEGGSQFSITAGHSDMTVEGARAAVVAKARHVDPVSGRPTETAHHLVITFDGNNRIKSVEEYAKQPLFGGRSGQ